MKKKSHSQGGKRSLQSLVLSPRFFFGLNPEDSIIARK